MSLFTGLSLQAPATDFAILHGTFIVTGARPGGGPRAAPTLTRLRERGHLRRHVGASPLAS
jgi:hypothetical protein